MGLGFRVGYVGLRVSVSIRVLGFLGFTGVFRVLEVYRCWFVVPFGVEAPCPRGVEPPRQSLRKKRNKCTGKKERSILVRKKERNIYQ